MSAHRTAIILAAVTLLACALPAAAQRALPPPTVSSISPTQGSPGQQIQMVINGANFRSGPTVELAPPGGVQILSAQTTSAQLMRVQLKIASDATPGPRQVTVKWGSQAATAPMPFTIVAPVSVLVATVDQAAPLAPAITGFAPTQGTQGQTLALNITATNLPAVQLQLGFDPPAGIQVLSLSKTRTGASAQIHIAPDAASGPRQLSLSWTPPAGTGLMAAAQKITAPQPFLVVAAQAPGPAIRNFSPQQGQQGQSLTLSIQGGNFPVDALAEVHFVPATGLQVTAVTIPAANQVQAQVAIAADAPPGPRQLSLHWGNVVANATAPFTVTPKPGITVVVAPVQLLKVTPNQAETGKKTTVKIEGKNFKPGAQVSVGGTAVFVSGAPKFVNSTELEVTFDVLPLAQVGGRDLAVKNVDGSSGSGLKMLNIVKPKLTAGKPTPVTTTGKPVIAIPPQSIKLHGPNDSALLWNFYGGKHRFKFAWKEAGPEKSDLYTISLRKPGETKAELQVQVSAFVGKSTTRRDFNQNPQLLNPAQVNKLTSGASYEWLVDGYDAQGKWVARSDVRKVQVLVNFSASLDQAFNFYEATVEAVPAPPGPGGKYVVLVGLLGGKAGGSGSQGSSSGSAVVPQAGKPVQITVRYGEAWSIVLQKAEGPLPLGYPALGGGDDASQAGKTQMTVKQTQAPPIPGAAGGQAYNSAGGQVQVTIPVDIRDPFGIGYDGDVCTYWGLIDFGDGSPPEHLGICSGWGSKGSMGVSKQHTYQKPGEYTVRVYTVLGSFFHLMTEQKISVAPPPCNLSGPLKLAQTNPFQVTSFSGYGAGEKPTIKTYAKLVPDPRAEIRYSGKGTIAIAWWVDNKLFHSQIVDLGPKCDEQAVAITMDSDVPHSVVGEHVVTARITGIAGGDPSTYPKPGGGKANQGPVQGGVVMVGGQPVLPPGAQSALPPGSATQQGSGQQQVSMGVILSIGELFGPTPISPPIAAAGSLKYLVDDMPPPPGVPTEVVFQTAQSGTIVISDLSAGSKVVNGKATGKGLSELFVADQAVTVGLSFSNLDVNFDQSTGAAVVTGGSVAASLSGVSFDVDGFEGQLTQFKVDTTAALLSGKILLPAAAGLFTGGSSASMDFSDAEYLLEPNFGHIYKSGLVLPKSSVFASGFQMESPAMALDLSKKKGSAPTTLCAGAPAGAGDGFLGFVLGANSKLTLPAAVFGDGLSANAPVKLEQTALLSSGFSRQFSGLSLNQAAELFGFNANLGTADLTWCGASFDFALNATLKKIPLLAGDLGVGVKLKKDGDFSANVTSKTLGPVSIGLLSLKGENFSLQFNSGQGVLVATDLTFSAGLGSNSSIANLKVKDLRISPQGDVTIGSAMAGGWQSLGSGKSVKFYGFGLSLNEVGAGIESAGGDVRLWLGVGGAFQLADNIIPANVSAKADRIRFKLKKLGTAFSYDGLEVDKIALDFSYAGVQFKGSIGWQGGSGPSAFVPDNPSIFAQYPSPSEFALQPAVWRTGGPNLSGEAEASYSMASEPSLPGPVPDIGGNNEKFYGDIDLSILGLLPGGKVGFLVGNASGNPYFLARLQYNLPPGGIPITPTPLSIQSILGGIGYKVKWGVLNAPANFSNPCDVLSVGGFDAPLDSITYDSGRTFTLKAGVGVGTAADNGQLLYLKGVLSLVSSGAISVDAGAWILGGDRNAAPHGCGHVGYYGGTFNGSLGIDLTFHPQVAPMFGVKGAAEIQFGKAGWHLYIGKKEAPINASLLGISNVGGANIHGYLMIDSNGVGAGAGMSKTVGKEKSGACFQVYGYATASVDCTLGLNLSPISADASAKVQVGGGLGFRIFCVTIGAGASGTTTLSAHLPPLEICGKVKACGEVCFIACKSGCASLGVCVP